MITMYLFGMIIGVVLFIILGTVKTVDTVGRHAIKKHDEAKRTYQLEELEQRGVLLTTFEELGKQEEEFQEWLKQEELKDKYEEFAKEKINN